MKPTLQTFSLSPMQFKLHLHADETKWNAFLNENIDTLVGLHEEVVAEGFDFHEKQHKGIIREKFFEAKSKHIIGDFKTYNPWTIRGDFKSVGSNIELHISAKETKSLRESLVTLVMFPLLIITILLFFQDNRPTDYLMLTICVVVPIAYHLISRWFQFTTLRHFIRKVQKEIEISVIPH